jgi:hypothetical protein
MSPGRREPSTLVEEALGATVSQVGCCSDLYAAPGGFDAPRPAATADLTSGFTQPTWHSDRVHTLGLVAAEPSR